MKASQELSRMKLFEGLSEADLMEYISMFEEVTHVSGDILIEESEISDSVYFISKGVVFVYNTSENGQIIPVGLLHKGQSIGEMGVVSDRDRSAAVEAVSFVKGYRISSENFRSLVTKYPSISQTLLNDLAERIRQEGVFVSMNKTMNLSQKAFVIIQELAQSFPQNTIHISHEKLSQIVGVTRPRLTEALNMLQDEGKIVLAPSKIQLL